MNNTEFVEECKKANIGDIIERETLSFEELYNLKYPVEYFQIDFVTLWYDFSITATTLKDFTMRVWNGHGAIPEFTEHICPTGTKVLIWMVSRMGDIGITDNLTDPNGYDCRGLEGFELTNWEILRIS